MPPSKIHKITPTLFRLAVPIGDITPHDENYRRGNVEVIRTSLQRFGQVKPIVVQKSSMKIVAGNHTYKGAVEEGWTHIAAAIVDLDDFEARAYLVADNRTSDLATNDDEQLARILASLAEEGKLAGTGFDPDDVDDLLAKLAAIPPVEPGAGDLPQAPVHPRYEGKDPQDATRGAGALSHREVVLVLTTVQAEQFGKDIKRLEKVYDTTGTASTVFAAVRAAAERADAVPA